ncbi:hypothetical protein cypCar_00031473 [Cyprinus carpio]|nr:hypothetical protein cypCar_00031473 [Cyprinus carpio]
MQSVASMLISLGMWRVVRPSEFRPRVLHQLAPNGIYQHLVSDNIKGLEKHRRATSHTYTRIADTSLGICSLQDGSFLRNTGADVSD